MQIKINRKKRKEMKGKTKQDLPKMDYSDPNYHPHADQACHAKKTDDQQFKEKVFKQAHKQSLVRVSQDYQKLEDR